MYPDFVEGVVGRESYCVFEQVTASTALGYEYLVESEWNIFSPYGRR